MMESTGQLDSGIGLALQNGATQLATKHPSPLRGREVSRKGTAPSLPPGPATAWACLGKTDLGLLPALLRQVHSQGPLHPFCPECLKTLVVLLPSLSSVPRGDYESIEQTGILRHRELRWPS
jgi:hypothetical protein